MRKLALALALTSLSWSAHAVEVAGVKLPDTEVSDGKTLRLNGAGLRKKAIFKVYVLALYLETPSKDAATVIASDQIKSLRMSFLRSVSGPKIGESITEGFERNSRAEMPKLKDRLGRLAALIPDLAEGDEIVLTYVPGKGTTVRAKGTERGVLEGKDFADALVSVWLGPDPVQEDLKKALLGG